MRILRFFRERLASAGDVLLHFELVPDRLPQPLRDEIAQFPAGSLQFEVGVQSMDDEVNRRISRRQSRERLVDNISFLRERGVYLHTDLIAGLPGESLASFGRGFDQLFALGPAEIQVGVLKRLNGAPIARHDEAFGMIYSSAPPYEVLATADVSFAELQQIKRFARYWDLVANSGNFRSLLPLLCAGDSPFEAFFELSRWLHTQIGQTHSIALDRLAVLLVRFLEAQRGEDSTHVRALLADDYQRSNRSLPRQLGSHDGSERARRRATKPARQRRWLRD